MSKLGAQSKAAAKSAFSSENLGGTLGSLGSGISDVVSAGVKNAQIADTTSEEEAIKDTAGTQFNYDDYDSLLSAYNPSSLGKTSYTRKDVRGVSGGEMALNTVQGTLSGAATGAQVGGPWGAIAGAVVGLGSGLAGIFTGDAKADAKAAELNLESAKANQVYLQNFSNNAENISDNMFNSAAINIAALGGMLSSSVHPYIRAKVKLSSLGGNMNTKRTKYNGFGNYFSYGGTMNLSGDWSNGVTIIGEGGSHEQNPYAGVHLGIDEQGVPNLVEEGEVIFDDYVFSRRLKPTRRQLKDVFLNPKYDGKTFAEIATIIQKESAENPNDPISKNTLFDGMAKLMTIQEDTRAKKAPKKSNKYEGGGWVEALRFAPVVGSGLQAIGDAAGWTNKADYTNPSIIRNQARQIRNVSAKPIGQYMTYNPFDTNYQQTKLGNAGIGALRAIQGNYSGNRSAATSAMLATNNNAIGQMGDLFRSAREYNDNQRRTVQQFNAGIDQFNSQMALQAAAQNQRADFEKVDAAVREAALRDQIDSAVSAAKSQNITNFFNNLGALGTDAVNNNMAIDFMKSNGLWDQYQSYVKGKTPKKFGGKIVRGFTLN